MKIRTKQDYVESLRDEAVVYFMGERVRDRSTFPAFVPHINSAAKTYELALAPEHEDLLTATSHLTGRKISRFTHIHQSIDDLIKKVQMLRVLAHATASCFQRCWVRRIKPLYITTLRSTKIRPTYFPVFRDTSKRLGREFYIGWGHDRSEGGSLQTTQSTVRSRFVYACSEKDRRWCRDSRSENPSDRRRQQSRDMVLPTQAMKPAKKNTRLSRQFHSRPKGSHLSSGAKVMTNARPRDSMLATANSAWLVERRSSSSMMSLSPGSGYSCVAKSISAESWSSALPRCIGKTMEDVREGSLM